jgi:uncharacterized protein (DUF1697 family)
MAGPTDAGSGDPRHVVLLRGVNVGGTSVPMAALRSILSSAGYRDVTTYIQSGNVILGSDERDPDRLARGVADAIDSGLGTRVAVVVVNPDDPARVCAGNPFADRDQTGRLYVTFLDAHPDPDALADLDPAAGAPDQFVHDGRWIYVWCEGGYGTTELSNRFFERALRRTATTRNWRTVSALARMAAG